MSKTIEITEDLEKLILDDCKGRLDYFLKDAYNAEFHTGEIDKRIKLLDALGCKNVAKEYKKKFKEYMDKYNAEYNDSVKKHPSDAERAAQSRREKRRELFDSLPGDKVRKVCDSIEIEFACFSNGHSSYMVCGIEDEDTFKDYLAKLSVAENEPIAGFAYFAETKTAYFDTCEGYAQLTQEISEDYPDAIVYGTGQWDIIDVDIYKNGQFIEQKKAYAHFALDDAFEDGCGNLRIDVDITDKKTGSVISIGDLICFDSAEEVNEAEYYDSYVALTGLLCGDDQAEVETRLNECRNYWEDRESEMEQ